MIDQQTQTIVITGGTGGIGFQSALGLAKTGARILIVGRNKKRGEEAVRLIINATNNQDVTFIKGDISSLANIDKLADDIRIKTKQINVLVNNAGYLGSHHAQNEDGIEMHFAVNVLAPWHLTKALLPELQSAKNSRVINVSGGDKPARIDPDNLQAEKGFKGLMTYTHSKSIMEGMSMILAEELKPLGITVNVVFPGRASTVMTQTLSLKALPGAMKLMYPLFRLLFKEDGGKSANKAAQSTIWSATSPELVGVTGTYFDTNSVQKSLHPTAYEPKIQAQIRTILDDAKVSATLTKS